MCEMNLIVNKYGGIFNIVSKHNLLLEQFQKNKTCLNRDDGALHYNKYLVPHSIKVSEGIVNYGILS